MIISKISWHYRFNNWINDGFQWRFDEGRYTTCSYIRVTLGSFLTAIFKAIIILALGLFGAAIIASTIGVPIAIFLGKVPADIFVGLCLGGWLITSAALAGLLSEQIKVSIRQARARAHKYVKEEPNVFVQAIIDHHSKFCTRVTGS